MSRGKLINEDMGFDNCIWCNAPLFWEYNRDKGECDECVKAREARFLSMENTKIVNGKWIKVLTPEDSARYKKNRRRIKNLKTGRKRINAKN